MSEKKRTYRQFTPEQKTEIVLAGIRADRSVRDVCREHEIAEALYYDWRDRLLEGGKAALATPRSRTPEAAEAKELRKKIASPTVGPPFRGASASPPSRGTVRRGCREPRRPLEGGRLTRIDPAIRQVICFTRPRSNRGRGP